MALMIIGRDFGSDCVIVSSRHLAFDLLLCIHKLSAISNKFLDFYWFYSFS